MNKQQIAIIGTGPLGLWTAAALAGDPAAPALHIRMGNTRGKAPAWVPEAVRSAQLSGRLTWHALDALNAQSVHGFAAGSTAIVQTAVPQYHEWAAKLPVIQRNVIEAALAGRARLICADNLYAYAAPASGPLTEQSPEIPPSGKGQVRKDLLDMMRTMQSERGLVWATVQASQYFGPGAGAQSVFGDWFIDPALQGKPVRFVGDPSLRHAWAYAPDIGRAMSLLALTQDARLLDRHWILPHVTQLPANDLSQLLFRELDRQGVLPGASARKASAVPGWLLKVLGWFNPVIKARQEMLYQFQAPFEASGAQFAQATGFIPAALDEAVAATVGYWKKTKLGQA
ncbi:MAG: NAD-dependent epimerase/dehydratase family protein [Pseudomonadota bacterium]